MSSPTRRPVTTAAVAVVAIVVAGALSACGGEPETTGPSGVDGLVIPTPSADPADFVGSIDNPWLPLSPGATWEYDVTDGPGSTVTVTVTDRTREVEGVATTVVDVVTADERRVTEVARELYAQDAEGNVWRFGERTTTYDGRGRVESREGWEAGTDGARAGLAMAADPRVGDGYREGYLPGVAEDVAEVLAVDQALTLDAGSWNPVVLTADRSALEPGVVEQRYYARGVGLVLVDTVAGGDRRLELASYTAG